jgi:hypothetical protein
MNSWTEGWLNDGALCNFADATASNMIMAETVEQYIARIRANVAGKDPLAVVKQTPAQIRELVAKATPEQLDYRPAPGKWSIREQIAHLADTEIMVAARVRWAAAEPGTTIVAFDQDKWANTSRYAKVPVQQSVALFSTVREATVAFIQQLSPQERANAYAQHAERGKETLERILEMAAGHDINHLKSMTELAAKADR